MFVIGYKCHLKTLTRVNYCCQLLIFEHRLNPSPVSMKAANKSGYDLHPLSFPLYFKCVLLCVYHYLRLCAHIAHVLADFECKKRRENALRRTYIISFFSGLNIMFSRDIVLKGDCHSIQKYTCITVGRLIRDRIKIVGF